MKNPFKEILQDEKLPDEIKKRVMADVAIIKLSIDMADLFAVKYPGVFHDLIKNKNKPEEEDGDEGDASGPTERKDDK